MIEERAMSAIYLDSLVDRLLPQVLADPDLGDGRVFTRLHFRHLWALSCLHVGECYDEELLATCLPDQLRRRLLVPQRPVMNHQEEELGYANHDDTGAVFERIQ